MPFHWPQWASGLTWCMCQFTENFMLEHLGAQNNSACSTVWSLKWWSRLWHFHTQTMWTFKCARRLMRTHKSLWNCVPGFGLRHSVKQHMVLQRNAWFGKEFTTIWKDQLQTHDDDTDSDTHPRLDDSDGSSNVWIHSIPKHNAAVSASDPNRSWYVTRSGSTKTQNNDSLTQTLQD